MTIGEILKKERKKRGYTQEEIAKYLIIARPAYTQYETGTNMPTTSNLIKLADLYNVSVDYLLGRYQNHKDTDLTDLIKFNKEHEKRMVESIKKK